MCFAKKLLVGIVTLCFVLFGIYVEINAQSSTTVFVKKITRKRYAEPIFIFNQQGKCLIYINEATKQKEKFDSHDFYLLNNLSTKDTSYFEITFHQLSYFTGIYSNTPTGIYMLFAETNKKYWLLKWDFEINQLITRPFKIGFDVSPINMECLKNHAYIIFKNQKLQPFIQEVPISAFENISLKITGEEYSDIFFAGADYLEQKIYFSKSTKRNKSLITKVLEYNPNENSETIYDLKINTANNYRNPIGINALRVIKINNRPGIIATMDTYPYSDFTGLLMGFLSYHNTNLHPYFPNEISCYYDLYSENKTKRIQNRFKKKAQKNKQLKFNETFIIADPIEKSTHTNVLLEGYRRVYVEQSYINPDPLHWPFETVRINKFETTRYLFLELRADTTQPKNIEITNCKTDGVQAGPINNLVPQITVNDSDTLSENSLIYIYQDSVYCKTVGKNKIKNAGFVFVKNQKPQHQKPIAIGTLPNGKTYLGATGYLNRKKYFYVIQIK